MSWEGRHAMRYAGTLAAAVAHRQGRSSALIARRSSIAA